MSHQNGRKKEATYQIVHSLVWAVAMLVTSYKYGDTAFGPYIVPTLIMLWSITNTFFLLKFSPKD